ncbi:MAG: hypothetical protein JOY62_13845 [Acidobacteriaceae bacterium]|nr:hypothetical protein [Acidobacteriaceae bacterium]MBV9781045.1 hypothetical protein [Acidobacteriaceae bacterium]
MTLPRAVIAPLIIFSFGPIALSQDSASRAPSQDVDPHKLVELGGIEVNGTRLPKESVIRISDLKVGQKVNYDIINEACHRLTSTGLISIVDYAYNLVPGKPGVVLSLNVSDELPLLPARIYPKEDEDQIWQCLQSADPIFTRELPNTQNALGFYSKNIDRCLENAGMHTAYTHPTTVCDKQGKATVVVFDIRQKQGLSAR